MTKTQDEKGPGRDPRAKDDDNSEGRHNTATGQAHQSPTARRLRLLDAGYAPVPVRGKHPPVDEWQKKTDTTIAEVESWATVYPNAHSDGSLTQRMPTFDIDVLNEQAAERVEQLIRQRFAGRGTVLVRIGRAPKRAIPFRTDTPFKKITQDFLAPDGSTNQKFEFLCNGQQVVMFGIHPDTGKPYQWFGGEPGEIRLDELPTISEGEATALFADAINIVAQFGYQPTRARPPTGTAVGSEDWSYLLKNIHEGHELHDSTRDLAAKLIVAGTTPGACVNLIRAAMDQSKAPRDDRFRTRVEDIPELVTSAQEKFGETTGQEPHTKKKTVEPQSLAEAHKTFRYWFGPEYDLVMLDAMLAVAAAEQLAGDPAWLMVVSGPGNAKTETVQTAALLSATSKRSRSKIATGGLLRTIGERGILIIKDFTSILSCRHESRASILAALREVYDGHWVRNVGTDGGQRLEWKGRIVLIGACTTAWDQAHSVVATMGDRFVVFRSSSHKGRMSGGRHAIRNTGSETVMRQELTEAVAGVIATVDPNNPYTLSDDDETAILEAANL